MALGLSGQGDEGQDRPEAPGVGWAEPKEARVLRHGEQGPLSMHCSPRPQPNSAGVFVCDCLCGVCVPVRICV